MDTFISEPTAGAGGVDPETMTGETGAGKVDPEATTGETDAVHATNGESDRLACCRPYDAEGEGV